MTTPSEEAVSEVHQFLSLVRARVEQAVTLNAAEDGQPRAVPADQSLNLWNATYGEVSVSYTDPEELASKLGKLIGTKMNVAAMVVAWLATRMARQEDRSIISVIDEVESEIVRDLEQPND